MLPGLLRSPRLTACLKGAGSNSSTPSSRYLPKQNLFGVMQTIACSMQNRTYTLVCTLKSSAREVIQVSP